MPSVVTERSRSAGCAYAKNYIQVRSDFIYNRTYALTGKPK
ncbi:hypothetical protein GXM_08043 [Nostoc sphaeroides CCNUC1]|uniref:Uncharacterized protein n=1 Tax=Nostoc sphaeroides CCNUC1 TaxID=2653204 RepID=A0A5P8WFE1_9NOSO|nr:hypothetical protein GXM_08043 [Nostoc sphaeroides CCNUC1]